MDQDPKPRLRTGFTTGACATAAATAAAGALVTGEWVDPVEITLPRGQVARFPLAEKALGDGWARAAIIKDAGDDPDVTHGVAVTVTIRQAAAGQGLRFLAGEGVGRVTRPGLPVAVGEPAINPVPRQMIAQALGDLCTARGVAADFDVEIAIPGGEEIAAKTWNPRLGIVGGLSILGTTGIVRPFSCAAWIASIHRGIDVARAAGLTHVAGATGATSEKLAQERLGLPDHAMLDMGDFAGGMLKYLARHPVPRVTIAGGFGKLTKLAQGAKDLHSARSQVDFGQLADLAAELGGNREEIAACNTASQALGIIGAPLAVAIADKARAQAQAMVAKAGIRVDLLVIDRAGRLVAIADADGARAP